MVGLECKEHILARCELFEMVDLNAKLVASHLDPAFEKAAEIYGVDHVAVRFAMWRFKVQRNIFWTQAQIQRLSRLCAGTADCLDVQRWAVVAQRNFHVAVIAGAPEQRAVKLPSGRRRQPMCGR